ncbi:hypothetical protein [Sorangium sp. So ce131]|uniref:hypothetical protein n=1 Tax=Sorangium sp. So ce131 TaxID=3133282 RepID=UPI003F62E4DE
MLRSSREASQRLLGAGIPWPRGRSLITFVDSALRAFAPEVWGEIYPSLYLELTEPAGRFEHFTKAPPGREEHLGALHAKDLEKLLREGRALKCDWYADLEQWREDIGDHSECAPELFDVFLNKDVLQNLD